MPGRRTATAERARSSLWSWPVVAGAASFLVGVLLTRVRPEEGALLADLWPGDVASASALLQTMATAVMTATALTFSVTVVALQLASQQFSPRLLREFGRDPVTKRVLSTLAATFVLSTVTLAAVDGDRPVPVLAVAGALLLGIASLAGILGFIAHIVRIIRVDTMMLVVHDEAGRAIETFYPSYRDERDTPEDVGPDLDVRVGRPVTADRSGFVQRTDVDRLVEAARHGDAVVRIEVRAGDHITRGEPIARVWHVDGRRCAPLADDIVTGVRGAVHVGYERTIDQDAGFGFRQLEDIAVKAMSPSINDPVTAAHAVGHMGDLLVRLTGCRLGPTLHRDHEGVGRAIVPDRDLRYYLDLATGQLRRVAASETSVIVALLRMLRAVATASRDDHQRREVVESANRIADQIPDAVAPHDAEAVRDLLARVRAAAGGDEVAAYADRSGETRSI